MATILFLENHAVLAQQVTRKFLANHKVTVVPSLSAARQALKIASFDLIFSVYDLGDGKGDEFVRECRINHLDLPIIAVSSHDAGNSALLRAGATVVCGKMEFDQIGRVIEPLLHE
jgi:DNA-binding response OmpR family regulator